MSRTAQRFLAGIALTAVLVLTAPAPSHAAGFRIPVQGFGYVDRIFDWLESLMAGSAEKPSPALREREGSMIDPNGGKILNLPSSSPTSDINSDEGSMIDPNGLD